ncbi:MAG TPA: serine/threonine-protein kinase, partial [Bryobacteraceae bacterium]
MRLAPAARIGPYEVVSPIGAGGMGEVYRARDTRLGRTVAIKILRQPDTVARAHFEQEARAICSLNHPFICNLYDVGQQDGLDYLVMEFIEGEVLAAILKRAPLPYDTVLLIATRIADALAAAHARGIVHRDLKPGNIMVTRSGVKLLDFGLAKTVVPQSSTETTQIGITQENGISGTVHYMAPEVIEGRRADTRSDIFAFGAVLYEMASGKHPFPGDSQARVIAAILEHRPAALRDSVPSIPPAFERLVTACLEKDLE